MENVIFSRKFISQRPPSCHNSFRRSKAFPNHAEFLPIQLCPTTTVANSFHPSILECWLVLLMKSKCTCSWLSKWLHCSIKNTETKQTVPTWIKTLLVMLYETDRANVNQNIISNIIIVTSCNTTSVSADYASIIWAWVLINIRRLWC